jgi:hypothetical protein
MYLKIFLLALLFINPAFAAEEKIRFIPTETLATCAGAECEYYDLILGDQSVTLERDGPSSAHGVWKLQREGRFYQIDFFYTDFPKNRHFLVVAHAGAESDVRKMSTGEASFDSDAMPDAVRVSTPFTEKGGKDFSFGLSIQLLELPPHSAN